MELAVVQGVRGPKVAFRTTRRRNVKKEGFCRREVASMARTQIEVGDIFHFRLCRSGSTENAAQNEHFLVGDKRKVVVASLWDRTPRWFVSLPLEIAQFFHVRLSVGQLTESEVRIRRFK